jgi:hypothetical protein
VAADPGTQITVAFWPLDQAGWGVDPGVHVVER